MKSRPIGVQDIFATDLNTRRDDARGGSFLLAHQQLGALALGTTPSNGQTVTVIVNGTSIVFKAVTGTPTNPGDVKAPGTALGFVTNLIAAFRRPDLTTATYIAISTANQPLIQYVGWAWPGNGTTIVPFSLNKNVNGATAFLTSFNITTTVTSGTWTSQTMQLYVEDGTYYINGTRYLFTGGSTPTVTGPVSNPRIDVLTIDTSGTLAWTTGTENASPVAPTYPSNKLAICELYNVVSETALYDIENQQTGQGYVSNDVRPMASYGPVFSAIAEDLAPDATDTRNIGENSSNEWLNIYAKNIYASSIMQLNGQNAAFAKYGGTGADGALSVTSGATNINLGGASVFIKNYSSISITGTGYLTFSNPAAGGTLIIFKCSGNCTITTSATVAMDLSALGGAGGAAVTSSGTPVGGNSGSAFGQWITGIITAANSGSNSAGKYSGGGGASAAANGSQDSSSTNNNESLAPALLAGKQTDQYLRYPVVPGSGGASGMAGATGTSGAGGIGGGSIIFEVAGALNITAAFKSNGANGGTSSNTDVGGGGGGGGGFFFFIYNTLTANTATFTTTGGTGANGGSSSGTGGAGANGGSSVVQNQIWV